MSSWTHKLIISMAMSFAPGLGTHRGSSNCTNTAREGEGGEGGEGREGRTINERGDHRVVAHVTDN